MQNPQGEIFRLQAKLPTVHIPIEMTRFRPWKFTETLVNVSKFSLI